MSWAYRGIIIALIILFSTITLPAGQNEKDRWFAKDKYEHFTISALYSAGIAKIAHRHFEMRKDKSIFIGIGITIPLGAAKEGIDHQTHKGNASVKDFIWDIAGTAAGALIANFAI